MNIMLPTGSLRRFAALYSCKKTAHALFILPMSVFTLMLCVCVCLCVYAKNSEVKYLTLQDLDELFELFGIRERNQVEEQEEEEEKDAEYHEKTKQNINYSRLCK